MKALVRVAPSMSCLLQLLGQGLEEANQEPGAEGDRERRVGEEKGCQVVGGPQFGKHAVQRNEEEGRRDQVENQDETGD